MRTKYTLIKSNWRISILIVLLISACSAAGVPYTNDPKLKLVDAYELERVGRAAPAQQLALEALDIYQKKGNMRGEADVYNFLGGFYRGRAYRNFGEKLLNCYHGSPRSTVEIIIESTKDDYIAEVFEKTDASIYIGGHSHMQMKRFYKNKIIITKTSRHQGKQDPKEIQNRMVLLKP